MEICFHPALAAAAKATIAFGVSPEMYPFQSPFESVECSAAG